MNKELSLAMEAAGLRHRTFKVEHLAKISTVMKDLVAQGKLDQAFYKDNLASFQYDVRSVLKDAKSVIVIAAPQGKSVIEFKHQGKSFDAVLPPTYLYPGVSSRIAKLLNSVLTVNNYAIARPNLPLKLLAVRSGLGLYGRNNVCYIPGMGSFFRLAAFITDYEFAEDSWSESKVMESCSKCTLCIDNCPTGTISGEHFLIKAQNCITNFNEYEKEMPEWIQSDWHDSIVGCMKCQVCCPQNHKLIDLIEERISFDEQETNMILQECNFNSLPQQTRDKVSYAGLEIYYKVLPRNLRLLIDRQ